jgi:hypothetical protein
LPAGMPLVVAIVVPKQPVVPFRKRISFPVAFGLPARILNAFHDCACATNTPVDNISSSKNCFFIKIGFKK